MYRMYGIRAMQELLPRSSCRGAIHRSIQLIYLGLFILIAAGDVLFGEKDPGRKQACNNRSPYLRINYLKPTHWQKAVQWFRADEQSDVYHHQP